MYIFFYLSILIFIVGIIFFIIGVKKEHQDLETLKKEKFEYLNTEAGALVKKCENLQQVQKQLELQRDAVFREQAVERERLADLRKHSRELLFTERERLQAEIDATRALKMEQLNNEYKAKKEVLEEDYLIKKKEIDEQLVTYQIELQAYQSKQQAINEAIRREEELQNEIDTHRIILTQNTKDDIYYLISIEPNINNKDLLHKLIWSEYLQQPFNLMLKKMFGNNIPKNVIYCIENIKTHKKYIGKTSAEVSKRWTEHIKTSLNIGGIKKQQIHDALFQEWDNFTFSILEEVKDNRLSEREKYYINFFETDKFGYNLKGGG